MTIEQSKIFKQKLTADIAGLIAEFEKATQTTVAGIHVRTTEYCKTFSAETRVELNVTLPNLVEVKADAVSK